LVSIHCVGNLLNINKRIHDILGYFKFDIGRNATNNSTNSLNAFGSLMSTSYLQSRESGLTRICQNFGLILESRYGISLKSMVNLVLSKYAVQNNIRCRCMVHI
jgi:hypothetical protein